MKRSIFASALLLFTSLATVSFPFESADADQPNILLLFADDAGYADFGFHGSAEMKTPRLDRLAAQGVLFTQAYVPHPTCGPSRAGLMTGRYPQRFGYEENNVPGYMSANSAQLGDDMGLPLDEITMADHLQQLGYRTAVFGKWHLGNADRFHPTKRGFDHFAGFRGGARDYFPYTDAADRPENRLEHGFGEYQEHEGYLTDVLADEAIEYIGQGSEQPFFAFVSFNAVHTPMQARPEDLAQFPDLAGNRQVLAAMTLAMDRAIGKILDHLEATGLAENTLVVFTNDNGGPSDANASNNFPLAGTKSTHLEGGVRVPFLVRWPGQWAPGTHYDQAVSTLDLLPTFFAAGGGDVSKLPALDGVDLQPFLAGNAPGRPHPVLFWKRDVRATVRDGDWKLLRYPDRPAELYNLAEDLSEQNDFAADYPERVRDMFKLLFEWETSLERSRWRLKRQYEKSDLERHDTYRMPAPH